MTVVSEDLFTPDDWVNLIKTAKLSKPHFNVNVMSGQDFISSADLVRIITNRKKNTDGNKINWFHMRSLSYDENEPFFVHVVSNDGTKQQINIKKNGFDADSFNKCDVPMLYPNGRPISIKKYNDLMQLMKYVPEAKRDFFIKLQTDDSEDCGLASDASDE